MSGLPPDQDRRDRAVQPGLSVHLEAPAGSGKTAVLLERYLHLLARAEAPEDILVLTFTRRAAGELRTRMRQLLLEPEADGDTEMPPHRARLEGLARAIQRRPDFGLDLFERLQISTFHAFCARLLSRAPYEAGLPLSFRQLDEQEYQRLRREAVEETRRRLAARQEEDPWRQALIRRLVRLNNNWPMLARQLEQLLGQRENLSDFMKLASLTQVPQRYRELLSQRQDRLLADSLGSLRQALGAAGLGRRWGDFYAALAQAGSPLAEMLPPHLPGVGPEDLPSWQGIANALLTKQGELRRSFTPSHGFPKGWEKSDWIGLIRHLPDGVVRLLREIRGLTLTRISPEEVTALQDLLLLLLEVIGVYQELCRAEGGVDFAALERGALNLLDTEDPGELLQRLDRRYRHLLVDEFQDTSVNQLSLLGRLMGDWQGGPDRTLMVVGDPKQSIYGWRQARLRLFLEVRRQGVRCSRGFTLIPAGLELETNFRATSRLIDWVNQVFGRTVLADPATLEGMAFHVATPAPGADPGRPPRLALFLQDPDDRSKARQAEGRWLAREIQQALLDLPPGEKIGVLLFTRRHLSTYLEALKAAGLTAKVREGLKLSASPAAHLHNLARALAFPADEVAWAALLRAPWTGLSLEMVSRTALSPGKLWLEKIQEAAAAPAAPAVLRTLAAALQAAWPAVGRRPLARILSDFLESLDGWEAVAATEGAAGVANALTYLDLIGRADNGLPQATWEKVNFSFQEEFQPPDPQAQESPVEFLTVHGAKGLEFHTVFLPFLDWQPLANEDRRPPFLLEEIPGAASHGLALAPPSWQHSPGADFRLLKTLRDRRILAEARRVFYVAATRAKRRLLLSGVLATPKKGPPTPPAQGPLAWLWGHFGAPEVTPGASPAWMDPETVVEIRQDCPPLAGSPPAAPTAPAALRIAREELPYRLEFPSRLAVEEPFQAVARPGDAEASRVARARGEVIHALLETLSRGAPFPDAAGVAAALRRSGLFSEDARRLAPQVLEEVRACRDDPVLKEILRPDWPTAMSEWLLEDAAPGLVRRGQMDRLIFNGREWWLVDYKTSRPPSGEDWEGFLARETEKYRPQLLAYREMAARFLGLAGPAELRLLLYFTACRRAVVL